MKSILIRIFLLFSPEARLISFWSFKGLDEFGMAERMTVTGCHSFIFFLMPFWIWIQCNAMQWKRCVISDISEMKWYSRHFTANLFTYWLFKKEKEKGLSSLLSLGLLNLYVSLYEQKWQKHKFLSPLNRIKYLNIIHQILYWRHSQSLDSMAPAPPTV